MRKIDLFAGKPIVFFLGILKKLQKFLLVLIGKKYIKLEPKNFFFRGEIKEEHAKLLGANTEKKFVIAKFFGLGSIILTSPLIQEIKESNPKNKVIFLTFKQNTKLLEILRGIDEVISICTDNFVVFVKDTISAIVKLRRENPDIFYDLEFFSKFSAILSFLSGAKIKVGLWSLSEKRGGIHDIKVKYNPSIHIAENFLSMNRTVGIDGKEEKWDELMRQAIDEKKIKKIKEKVGGKYRDILNKKILKVAINPFPSEVMSELKTWDMTKWEKLIDEVSKEAIVFVLGKDSIGKKFRGDYVFDFTGETNFEEFIFLIHESDIIITLDSFPLHIGFAMGKKIVSLFGPESPAHYGYRGENISIIYKGIPCSPCINIFKGKVSDLLCNKNLCMQMIEVNEVFNEYKKIKEKN